MAATTDNYTHPQELMVGIRLTGNGWDGVTLFSIYCRPIRSLALLLKPLRSLGNHDMTVLCMDANATHPNWSPDWEDKGLYSGRGEDLEDFRAFCKLQVANRNLEDKKKSIEKQATEDNEGDTSDEDKTEANNDSERNSKNIDVTLYGTKLRIAKWERLEDKSSSDHRYITFSIFRVCLILLLYNVNLILDISRRLELPWRKFQEIVDSSERIGWRRYVLSWEN
jgi:hypothetical protein